MTSWPDGVSSAAPLPDQKDPGTRPAQPHPERPAANQRDTVPRRIGVLVAVLLTALVLAGAVGGIALIRKADTADHVATGYTTAGDANTTAALRVSAAEAAVLRYAISGAASALTPLRQARAQVGPLLAQASSALARTGDRSLDAALTAERRAAAAWFAAVGVPSNRKQARRAALSAAARTQSTAFSRANGTVAASIAASREGQHTEASDQRRFGIWFLIGLALLVALTALYAGWATRRVARPLTGVWQTVRRLNAGELSARADEFSGPAEVREIAAAVNNLAVERRRAVAGQAADDRLRREVRSVTSAIRIGRDSQAMARALVAGLGRTYDVDRVWLQTFDEQRVAVISEQWRRDRSIPEIAPSATEHTELRWLANRLWHSGSVVGINDHNMPPDDADRYLLRAPQALGARASAVAAVGEGGKALGLLWLTSLHESRGWTSAELGLLQHVAGELAQNLVQNYVVVQQRDAMRRLREADEAKTALVSTVSHELRTPLTSIIGYLDVLLDMNGDSMPPEVAGMLRVIERNAHRLRALIEDLLTQSQIEAGRRLVELARVDLVDVLTEMEETIEPLADNAHLGFDLDLPERGFLIIDGDPRQLGQAVTNLAANAIKFTPRGGLVVVSAAREPGRDGVYRAVIRVRDTGIGIPSDELPQLFDRFFRATNARKAVIQGTGLGLAIVAEIVTQHSGTIEVESELGRGTTFIIRLPLADTTSETSTGTQTQTETDTEPATDTETHAAAPQVAAAGADRTPGTVEAADDPVRES